MQDKTKVNLVSSEVSELWNTYVFDSLASCTLKHSAISPFEEDGLDILIQNGWMEQPPKKTDHRNLVN